MTARLARWIGDVETKVGNMNSAYILFRQHTADFLRWKQEEGVVDVMKTLRITLGISYICVSTLCSTAQARQSTQSQRFQFNSSSAEQIVFASRRDGNVEIYAMNPDGSQQTNLTKNPADDYDPNLSSDGSKIVFESVRNGNADIYILDLDTRSQTRLTNDPAEDYDPCFSPDMSRIAFTSYRDGNAEIYVMNSDGSRQTRITNDPAWDAHPCFSPDGKKIVFASVRDKNCDVYIMNVDGTQLVRLTDDPATDFYVSFSHDGTRIAFTSNRTGNDDIYLMNVDGSNQRNLTNRIGADRFPCSFSPDDSKIAFTSDRDGDYEIYLMDIGGLNQTRLTYSSEMDRQPSWGHRKEPTDVGPISLKPSVIALQQNYPNPFNPSTSISYELPVAGSVTLKIFNALGQNVVTLLDGHIQAGYHQIQWQANVPSGFYFYRLQAGDASTGSARGFVETKKMLLLK